MTPVYMQGYANSVKQLMARTMDGPFPTTPPMTSRPLHPPVLFTPSAFRKANPSDLGPVAFAQWAGNLVNKSDLHTKYLAIASNAASSEDLDLKAIGKQMQELWVNEQAALKFYWKDQEPLRKLRTRNIISVANDSSKLQNAVGRHQLHQSLLELQREQEHQQQE
ncbi:hypothetical protein BGX27_004180 [Mortierella sp. AM989]|nr:hypothetical protein BGX27_004180 [Mortierella sp. AM989]